MGQVSSEVGAWKVLLPFSFGEGKKKTCCVVLVKWLWMSNLPPLVTRCHCQCATVYTCLVSLYTSTLHYIRSTLYTVLYYILLFLHYTVNPLQCSYRWGDFHLWCLPLVFFRLIIYFNNLNIFYKLMKKSRKLQYYKQFHSFRCCVFSLKKMKWLINILISNNDFLKLL